jgi:uncharacterized membrane protein HdeD (DUF308 family)
MESALIVCGIILLVFGISTFSFLERVDLILAYYTGIAFVPIGIVMVVGGTATAIRKEKTRNGMVERI